MKITFDGEKLEHELNHKLSSTIVFEFNLDDVRSAIDVLRSHTNFNTITIDADVKCYDSGVLMDTYLDYDISISYITIEVNKNNIFFIVALDDCGENVEYSGYITWENFEKMLNE